MMARIRTIKPEFFRHEELFEAEKASGLPLRIAFAGMFTVCDRDGRFKWQPRVLKLDVMPFDDVDFAAVLDALADHGFIEKYSVDGCTYGHIPSWSKHQHVNQREPESTIPAPDEDSARTCKNIPARVEGKGRGGEREWNGTHVADATAPTPKLVSAKRGTRMAPDWQPSPENRSFASSRGVPEAEIAKEAQKFRDHWLSKAGPGGVKLDWDATWRTWIMKACEWRGWAPLTQAEAGASVAWITMDDPRWQSLAERYRREKGHGPPHTAGLNGSGWHFPSEWIEDRAA